MRSSDQRKPHGSPPPRSRLGRVWLLPLCAAAYACGSRGTAEGESPTASDASVRPEQHAALARLESATQAKWTWTQNARRDTLSSLTGRADGLLKENARGFDTTVQFLETHGAAFRMRAPTSELREARSRGDELGMHHVRMQQMVRGLPVWGREIAAHYDARGALIELNATYAPGLDALDVNPTLTLMEAIANAKADLTATRSLSAGMVIDVENPELTVYAPEEGAPALGYHMRLRVEDGQGAHPAWDDYMIDARSGVVLNKFDNLQHAEGSGRGVLGDQKTLQVATQNGRFSLYDGSRTPNGIHTFDSGNTQNFGQTYVSAASATAFSGPGVDAHFYAGVVYDFYKQKLNRLALDGQNGAMLSYVRYSQGLDNAFWDGRRMAYGDGSQVFRPLAGSLDVVAHEFTHGVTQTESNLVYQGQSGALNESMSDIFGAIIENFLTPDVTKNFLMGEAIGLQGPIRDMKNPAAHQQPSHMTEYVRTQQDNGGVHINSGIPNNAMYLMTIGGTNPKSRVQVPAGIGWDKSAKLWYRVNAELLLQNSNFTAAAQATQRAATDLGFTDNEKSIIDCAWIATGVTTGACKPLTTQSELPGTSDAGTAANGPVPGSSSGANGETPSDEGDGTAASSKKKKSYASSDDTAAGCQSAGDALPRDVGMAVVAAVALLLSGRRRRNAATK